MSSPREALDKVFSIYIRKRDCHGGVGRCISCGRPITFETCDAGHFIPRTHTATRYDVRNVNAQCRTCNRMMDGNIDGYRRGLELKYGDGTAEALETKGKRAVKIGPSDFLTLKLLFTNLTNKL